MIATGLKDTSESFKTAQKEVPVSDQRFAEEFKSKMSYRLLIVATLFPALQHVLISSLIAFTPE